MPNSGKKKTEYMSRLLWLGGLGSATLAARASRSVDHFDVLMWIKGTLP